MDSSKSQDEYDHHPKGEPSELWKKMALMRKLQERFQALQDEDEMDANPKLEEVVTTWSKSGRALTKPDTPKAAATASIKANARWSKIRRIVLSDKINRLRGMHSANATPSHSPRLIPSDAYADSDDGNNDNNGNNGGDFEDKDGEKSEPFQLRDSFSRIGSKKNDTLELEDINLDAFWEKTSIIRPFEITEDISKQIHRPEAKERVFEEFDSLVTPQALPVSRIPEEIVHEKKSAIEKATIEKHKAAIAGVKKMETDIVWREDLARKRVKEMEKKARNNLLVEKAKVVKLTMDKDRDLGLHFRKAREDLEAGIKRQEGAVKEHFGSITVHRDSLARKYQVFTQMFPQPIEMRVHMLRGVKNKLPKGAYALMLTQYDSLGGHPISWTHLDACGIGSTRPGITRVVKHPGRYFDRIIRFEDSIYALCPPGPKLRPSFVFVLELFHLSSHKNPTDEIVAWTAMPMTFENMTLIEGKMRLPMIRGEHSQYYQHFRTMEQTMANNLSNWLCNIYLEVRHLSLQELGATEAMLKSVDYDLDYVNKSVTSGKDLQRVLLSYEAAYQDSIYSTNHKVSGKMSKDGSGDVLSPRPVRDEGLIPLLPVDKGIFRRKLSHHQGTKDVEKGDGAMIDEYEEKKGGNNASASGNNHANSSSSQNDNTASTAAGGGGGGNMVQQLSRFFSGRGNAVFPGMGQSTHSLASSHMNDNSSGLRNGKSSAFHGQSQMSKVENFVEHRQELIRKWKQNIRLKLSKLDNDDEEENEEIDVLERGYNLRDEEFLHPVQRGKLSGVESIDDSNARTWAAAGLEGMVVRKWQSEGPRLDSDAIVSHNRLSPKSPTTPASLVAQAENKQAAFFPENGGSSSLHPQNVHRNADGTYERDVQGWEELRDGRELSEYTMSIAYDPSRSKNLMPGAISRSKVRYMMLELFGDLFPVNYGTLDFYVGIFCFVFALWMRIYIHYLSQYLYILGVGTPLYDFQLGVLQISFKYASLSVSDATEVAIVAIGMLGNIVMMLILSLFGVMMYRMTDLMPDGFSKFFAAYGVVIVLDPYLITIIDLIYHNYGCNSYSEACKLSYPSAECDCFYGDFVKLYSRMLRDEGSGITGAFITFVLFFSCSVLSLFLLYEYLVYIHRDGRILDLWRRITAPNEEFFIPDDMEVSRDELMLVLSKCRRWIGPAGARRKVVIEEAIEKDPEHKNYLGKYTRYLINEVEKDGSSIVHRQFIMDHTGKILELFEDHKVKLQRQNVFAVFNTKKDNKGDETISSEKLSGRKNEDNADDVVHKNDPILEIDSDDDDAHDAGEKSPADVDTRTEGRRKSLALLESFARSITGENPATNSSVGNASNNTSRRNSHQQQPAVTSTASDSRRNSRQDTIGEAKESAARSTSETESAAPPTSSLIRSTSSIANNANHNNNSAPNSARGSARRSSNDRSPRPAVTLQLEHLDDGEDAAAEDGLSPLHTHPKGQPSAGASNAAAQGGNNISSSGSNSSRIPLFETAASSSNLTPRMSARNVTFSD